MSRQKRMPTNGPEDADVDIVSQAFLLAFGKRVREARHAVQKTQSEVAVAMGLQRTSVANIEAGEQSTSLVRLYTLAETLSVEVCFLLPTQEEVTQIARDFLRKGCFRHDPRTTGVCARCKTIYCSRCKAAIHPQCPATVRNEGNEE